ncbi:MAG: Glycine betaine ABC transport system, glycine betaine-binding protein OpuAC [uncultured Rubrobacteraceae bacterium]|uniref:Glycine betaine ABC transport system, glycine betaine-binding protein OpuAC n=1 Tax=uncultured Rubrobacteraceae bacterium TaxID=349277 RepID=A0A6J4R0Y4_9ACTN|nr:MAG: Glycine betaine ABC transport system, glycine betaine-binding protein OpuAC [uncultured Rubrobacteraceae bacterium]
MRAPLLPGLFFLLVVSALLTAGCGGGDDGKTLEIADIGWTENTAISALTKVLLEEELGYESVTVNTSDLDSVYEGVARGNLDAFQDVWLPNQQDLLASVEDDVELLGPWYRGQTQQGIGVPSYMDATSLDQLTESETDLLLGIEPSSVVMEIVSEEVIPAYDLDQKLVEASTQGMFAEVDNRYDSREEFAFVAWSPHWMNQRYDFRYLEDPKDAFGELNNQAKIQMVVNEDLSGDDPVAYAFMDAVTLDEEQLNDLESTINEVGDPLEGARQWAQEHPEVWQPWVEATENARES